MLKHSIAVVDCNSLRGQKIASKYSDAMRSIKEKNLNFGIVRLFNDPAEILSEIAALNNFSLISISIEDNHASSLVVILRRMNVKSFIVGIFERECPSKSFSFHQIIDINAGISTYANLVQQISWRCPQEPSAFSSTIDEEHYIVSDNSSVDSCLRDHDLLLSDLKLPGGLEDFNPLEISKLGDLSYEQNDSWDQPDTSRAQIRFDGQEGHLHYNDNDNGDSNNVSKRVKLMDIYSYSDRPSIVVPFSTTTNTVLSSTTAAGHVQETNEVAPILSLPSVTEAFEFRQGPDISFAPWTNILAVMKLVVSMSHGTSDLCIRFVDDGFLENFKFSNDFICDRCIEALVGPGTSRVSLNKLKRAVASGKPEGIYINLYRQDVVPLSCFVTVSVLSTSLPPVDSFGQRDNAGAAFGTLTIRSASVVGNAKFSGIGPLVGVDDTTSSNWDAAAHGQEVG